MASRKPRRNNNNVNNKNHAQPSDYESDFQNYISDSQQPAELQGIPAPPQRSNEELNLSVIQRHNPAVTSILSLAAYAVIYIFSPSTRQWEKSGMEGSMFVCQLTQGPLGEERYSVIVLNRRGLNNFDVPLTDGDDVELTDEYVILKTDYDPFADSTNNPAGTGSVTNANKNANGPNLRIYGLWIYSEPPPNSTAETRTLNAQMIRECATHAGHSLKLARERWEADQQNGMHVAAQAASATAAPVDEVQSSVAMGRQISLKDLFGQQRAQDDGWSVHAHSMGWNPQQQQPTRPAPAQPPYPQQDILGDLFRKAGLQPGPQG